MPGGAILETSIGLVFVILTVALTTTAVQEVLASALRWRANNLRKGIARLIDGDTKGDDAPLADRFYAHPLIARLGQQNRDPSYIPARIFVPALLDTIRLVHDPEAPVADVRTTIEKLPKGSALYQTLAPVIARAERTVADAAVAARETEAALEVWFDDAMERVSGWYKRQIQYWTLGIALILAVGLNVDVIDVGATLWRDPELRAAVTDQATAVAAEGDRAACPPQDPTEAPGSFACVKTLIEDLPVPVGWTAWSWEKDGLFDLLVSLPGWLITAFAASLGAPFWFDLLQRFVNIRSSGGRPEDRKNGKHADA